MSTPDSTTRPCTKCGGTFPATTEFFSRNRGRPDGLYRWCKACACAVRSRHRALHHERELAAAREWKAAHREELRLKRVEDHAAHPEKYAERERKWRQAHPEQVREISRKWREANPELVSALHNNRRARVKGNGGAHTPEDIRSQYARQRGRCFYCKAKVGTKYHVDHVMPLAKGGSNGAENLVIACADCNRFKNAKHPMDFAGRMF